MNIAYLFLQIQKRHEGPYGCSFIDMKFESEINYGFLSIFTFKCKICMIKIKLHSEDTKYAKMHVNKKPL